MIQTHGEHPPAVADADADAEDDDDDIDLLDGLLDARLDLRLLSLALHDTSTHAFLVHISLLNGPVGVSSSSSSSSWPLSSSVGPDVLHAPALPFPWATSLVTLLKRHLNLRLIPVSSPPSSTLSSLLPLLSSPTLLHQQQRPLHSLYPPLPPALRRHNLRVLSRLRASAPPRILERCAIVVKLSFLATLHTVLSTTRLSLSDTLSALPVHPPCSTLSSSSSSSPSPSPSPSPCRPRRRRRHASPAAVVLATPLPRTPSSPPLQYLVHGVLVSSHLLPLLSDHLSHHYAIHLHRPTAPSHPSSSTKQSLHPGSLSSLSNHPSFTRTQTSFSPTCPTASSSRPPSPQYPSVDHYLADAFNTTWPRAMSLALKHAQANHVAQRRTHLSHTRDNLSSALHQLSHIRTSLVQRALALEVAGAPLSRICAFQIVSLGSEPIESRLRLLGDGEYDSLIADARKTLSLWQHVDSRGASRLISTLVANPS